MFNVKKCIIFILTMAVFLNAMPIEALAMSIEKEIKNHTIQINFLNEYSETNETMEDENQTDEGHLFTIFIIILLIIIIIFIIALLSNNEHSN